MKNIIKTTAAGMILSAAILAVMTGFAFGAKAAFMFWVRCFEANIESGNMVAGAAWFFAPFAAIIGFSLAVQCFQNS